MMALAPGPEADTSSTDFDVFISYRHQDARKHARRIRRWLQQYRLPEGIDAKTKRPLRIYVDTYEGPANADFWQKTIEPALKSSRFLVVLASPSVFKPLENGEKNWVMREIDTFLQTPQRENIIPIITPDNKDNRIPESILTLFPNVLTLNLGSTDSFVPTLPFFERPGSLELLRLVAAVRDVSKGETGRLFEEERRLAVRRVVIAGLAAIAVLAVVSAAGILALINGVAAARMAAESDLSRTLEQSRMIPDEASLRGTRALHSVTRSWLLRPFLADEEARIRQILARLQRPRSDIRWPGGRVARIGLADGQRMVVVLTETSRIVGYSTDALKRLFDTAIPFPYGPTVEMTVADGLIVIHGFVDGAEQVAVFDTLGNSLAGHRFDASEEILVLEDASLLVRSAASGRVRILDPLSLRERVALEGGLGRVEAATLVTEHRRLAVHTATGETMSYGQHVFDIETGHRVTPEGGTTRQYDPRPAVDRPGGVLFRITPDGRIVRQRLVGYGDAGAPIPRLFGVPADGIVPSPDGRMAVVHRSFGAEGAIEIWDLTGGQPMLHTPPINPANQSTGPVFSVSGDKVALALEDGVRVIRVGTAEGAKKLPGHDRAWAMSWSPDGRTLAVAYLDGRVVQWDVEHDAILQTGVRHHEGFVSLAHAGDALLSGGWDGSLRRTVQSPPPAPKWVVGEPIPDLSRSVLSIDMDANGQRLLIGTMDRTVSLCELATGACGWTMKEPVPSQPAFIGTGGTALVSANDKPGFRIRSLADGHVLASHASGMAATSTGADRVIVLETDGTLRSLDGRSGNALCTRQGALAAVSAVAVSPDGWVAVGVDNDGNAFGADTGSCRILWKQPLEVKNITIIRFSADSRLFAVGGASGGAVFHTGDGRFQGVRLEDRHTINALDFHPSKPLLLVAGMSRRIAIHDLETKSLVFSPVVLDAIPWSLAFDPCGQYFAVGLWADREGRFGVRLFDARSGLPIGSPLPHPREPMATLFVNGGGGLVSASADGAVRLWDLPPESRAVQAILSDIERTTGETINLETGAIRSLSVGGKPPVP